MLVGFWVWVSTVWYAPIASMGVLILPFILVGCFEDSKCKSHGFEMFNKESAVYGYILKEGLDELNSVLL